MLNLRHIPAVLVAVLLTAFQMPAHAAPASVEVKSIAEREIVSVTSGK